MPQWFISIFNFGIFTAEVDQINLILYNQMHVDQALELVKSVPDSMEFLTVGLLSIEGDQQPAPAIPPADHGAGHRPFTACGGGHTTRNT